MRRGVNDVEEQDRWVQSHSSLIDFGKGFHAVMFFEEYLKPVTNSLVAFEIGSSQPSKDLSRRF